MSRLLLLLLGVAFACVTASTSGATIDADLNSWEKYDCTRQLGRVARDTVQFGRQTPDVKCTGELENTFALLAVRSVMPTDVVFRMMHPAVFAHEISNLHYVALCKILGESGCETHGRAERWKTWHSLTAFVVEELTSPRSATWGKFNHTIVPLEVPSSLTKFARFPSTLEPDHVEFIRRHFVPRASD